MSRKLVNVRIHGVNGTGPCIEGWVDTNDCTPIASRPIYTMFEGGAVIPNAVITPAGACPPAAILQGQSENTTLQGQDCAGAALQATGPIGQLTQIVQAPGQVLTVRMCPASQDSEIQMLCAPNGDKIVLQYNVSVVPPALQSAWNLNTNTAYAGTVAGLGSCGGPGDKVNTESTDYCAGGLNFTRVDALDELTGLPVWTMWLDDNGLPVAAPVGAKKGICRTAVLDTESFTEQGCANNVPYTRLTRQAYNEDGSLNGASVALYVNSAGTSSTTAPAGFTLGECGCAPTTTSGLQPAWGF